VTLTEPRELAIFVTSGDGRPQGDCSAKTWVSDALDFGFQVVYYGQNASHFTAKGIEIPTRRVEDYGALSGVRDRYDVWPVFVGNVLEDLLKHLPEVKFVMRLDDDSFLNPATLWRSLQALPLKESSRWMIGDCGPDEHHSMWCSGGAGIVLSRPLAELLSSQLQAGVRSLHACAVLGRNDDDTMGICASKFGARIMNHRGFHPFPPAKLEDDGGKVGEGTARKQRPPLPPWTFWPLLGPLLGAPSLDGKACRARKVGPFAVVQDWITYHHMTCEQQHALSAALRAERERPASSWSPPPESLPCAGALPSGRLNAKRVEKRCEGADDLTRRLLCGGAS